MLYLIINEFLLHQNELVIFALCTSLYLLSSPVSRERDPGNPNIDREINKAWPMIISVRIHLPSLFISCENTRLVLMSE